jgi:hypothetical protein
VVVGGGIRKLEPPLTFFETMINLIRPGRTPGFFVIDAAVIATWVAKNRP